MRSELDTEAHAPPATTAHWTPLPSTPVADEDDPRVIRALEEYVDAVEAGNRPDRREFLARYPDIGSALEACLDGVALMRSAASHFGSSSPRAADRAPEPPPPAELGDYRIVREVGRGGMGVVYEAEQVSLGRRVAIKILPFAAALDPRQLQRFKVEAQAAALLHHPHIVPIYTVGCDRGVHYYAMPFVEGPTLAELIRELQRLEDRDGERPTESARETDLALVEGVLSGRFLDDASKKPEPHPTAPAPIPLRDPAPDSGSGRSGRSRRSAALSSTPTGRRGRPFHRTVAQLGLHAAEAIEHAHGLGVLHRDIKPGNLMLDSEGRLWVTDFGLARLEGEASLTNTGDLLGTLRYMSPEQALANRVVVDHRTDVYSLGVTLYELLTLRPAFDGRDRQDLLRQIAEAEPIPPRKLAPSIPRDLETIVLKAMAKDPDDRYDTAQQMADDLGRFLSDESILARRPGPIECATRWARRHRPLVGASVAILAVTLVALAVGTILLLRENQRALENQATALEALDQACRFIDEDLEYDPGRATEARQFFDKVLSCYDRLIHENVGDSRARWEKARAYHNIGKIQMRLDRPDLARSAFDESGQMLEKLISEFPRDRRYREEMAHIYLEHRDDPDRAHALYRDLAAEVPGSSSIKLGLAQSLCQKGQHGLRARQIDQAEKDLRQAMALLAELESVEDTAVQAKITLAQAYYSLGELLRLGRFNGPEAEAAYQRSISIAEALSEETPTDLESREILAESTFSMCCPLIARPDQPEKRERLYKQSVVVWEKLAKDFPSKPRYQKEEAQARTIFASFLHEVHRYDEAAQEQGRVLGTLMDLAGRHPKVTEYRAMLYGAFKSQADVLGHLKRATELASVVGRVLELEPDEPNTLNDFAWFLVMDPAGRRLGVPPARVVALSRRSTELSPSQRELWNTLGVAQYRADEIEAAEASLRKSLELGSGGDAFDWFFLAMISWKRGDRDEARNWYDRACAWAGEREPPIKSPPKNTVAYFRWATAINQAAEVRRCWVEAAELMGLPLPPERKYEVEEGVEVGPVATTP